MQHKQFRINK